MRILAALLLSMPAISLAQQIAIGEYAVDTPEDGGNFYPAITAGPDGALWFTDPQTNQIKRMTTAGAVTGFQVPFKGSPSNEYLWGIAAGADGALWFTELYGDKIGRITTTGVVSEYHLPDKLGNWPTGITAGPDSALWFTEPASGKIGRITTAGAITEYRLPNLYSSPQWITAGPDGALWFTEFEGNKIGRITTTGVVTEYPVPTAASYPGGITAGPDGAVWFTEAIGKIGRITTRGTITEFSPPTGNGQEFGAPQGITAGPDGALWFTQITWANIGRVTTAGAFTWYPVPNAITSPYAITTGPDGELWFTGNGGGQIGEAVFVTANLSVTPPNGDFRSDLTFTGSGFSPGESANIYVSGVGSAVLANANADSSGSFTVTAHAPQSVDGSRLFLGVGQGSLKLGAAPFSMAPKLTLNPDAGMAGSSVAVNGFGFGSFQTVSLYWYNTTTLIGSVTTDVHGTFNGTAGFTFTIPAGAVPGVYGVIATGSYPTVDVSSPFTVE